MNGTTKAATAASAATGNHSMKYNTATPYIASYVVVRKDSKIAFVLRSNTNWMNNYWGLPSGKVEVGESFLAAAVREAKEEIGIEVNKENLKHCLIVHRHEPSSFATDWVDMYFEVMVYSGELYNAEPHMHSELAWLDPLSLPDNVIPSVRDALHHIHYGKMYSEYGWDAEI